MATFEPQLSRGQKLLENENLDLCDPIDGSPPGSTVPGILQARTLEWPRELCVQLRGVQAGPESKVPKAASVVSP